MAKSLSMKISGKSGMIGLLLMISCGVEYQSTRDPRGNIIDSLMQYSHENGVFNGTILVAEEGKIIYQEAMGLANKDSQERLTIESQFYLASVSKQFTTMAVMILKEQGKLSYDDNLTDFFRDFAKFADEVNIRHLMTHTSGIPDHYRLGAYKPGLNNDDVYKLLSKVDSLDFEPGSTFLYSNGGYVLLSMIVENVSGQPYHVFMHENIFQPLELNQTLIYNQSDPEVPQRVTGYHALGAVDDYEIYTLGAGGMYSNIIDLHKWDQSLYANELISEHTKEEAFEPFTLSNGELSNYGFGWGLNRTDSTNVVSHTGGLNGFRTYLGRNIADQQTIIMLTNMGDAFERSPIVDAINDILNGQDFELPKIPIALVLGQTPYKTAQELINTYQSLKEENLEKYDFGEGQLNYLGYYLMNEREDLETAIGIFKLNIELYPEAFNVYNSMGEAYMKNGDYDKAVASYDMSLELNPDNQNAIEMLKKIIELRGRT